MAKTSTKDKPQTPAKVEPQAGLPAEMEALIGQDAGKGVSRAAYDNIVPLIYVLQPLSPQVDERSPLYIPGAKAGDIWLRDAPDPIIKGDDGFLFQPCFFWRDIVEWVPRERGGGYVDRYPLDSELEEMEVAAERLGARAVPDEDNPKRINWMTNEGNDLTETRYHAGFVHRNGGTMPFVIPLSSTGHTVSRRWMFMIGNRMTPSGTPLPSWAGVYRLPTIQKSNSSGRWFQFEPKFENLVDGLQDALDGKNPKWQPGRFWNLGRELHEAFAAGTKQAAAPEDQADAANDSAIA